MKRTALKTWVSAPLFFPLCFWAAFLAWAAISAGCLGYWALTPESQEFLLNYTDGRPLPQTLFDVEKNDHGLYQARELSYFFDFLDARFIRLCSRAGFPHFYSLTHLAALFLLAFLFSRDIKNFAPAPRAAGLLLLLLFLTSAPVVFSLIYYRSAKILTALFLFGLARAALEAARARETRTRYGLFLAWALPLPFFDRQGHFFLALALVLALFYRFFHRRGLPWLHGLSAACATALALSALYNHIAGPWLIFHYAGYWPDFWFQTIPPDRLTAEPWMFLARGVQAVCGSVSRLAGGFGAWEGGALLAALGFFLVRETVKPPDGSARAARTAGILFAVFLAALIVLHAVMPARLREFLNDPLFSARQYGLPMLALFLLLAARLLTRGLSAARKSAPGIALLTALLFANAAGLWSTREQFLKSLPLRLYRQTTRELALCVRAPSAPLFSFLLAIPEKGFSGEPYYLAFGNELPAVCQALRPREEPGFLSGAAETAASLAREYSLCRRHAATGALCPLPPETLAAYTANARGARPSLVLLPVPSSGETPPPKAADLLAASQTTGRIYSILRAFAASTDGGDRVPGLYVMTRDANGEDISVDVFVTVAENSLGMVQDVFRQRKTAVTVIQAPRGSRTPLLYEALGVEEILAKRKFCLKPEGFQAVFDLSLALYNANDLDSAAKGLEATLAMENKVAGVHNLLGAIRARQGRHQEALEKFRAALEIKPGCAEAQNNLAWLLATSPDPKVADGPAAIKEAIRAVSTAKKESAGLLDTLAAARARAGEYAEAVLVAGKAADLARKQGDPGLAREMEERKALYGKGEPFVEGAAAHGAR
jgi:tetratricopeptide (TPR) repeat protein